MRGLEPGWRRRWLLRGAVGAFAGALGLVALDLLFPFPLARLELPPATVVLDRTGAPLRLFLPADQRWRLPAEDGVPETLRRAILAAEDRRFELHPGVDPLAVLRAAGQNLAAGRVVSGASTITMQLARMAEPAPRTLRSKLVEAFRALQLESRLSKAEILELYLARAPYGGNVEGVGAAARFYFGKTVRELSVGEIALLVALPRAPRLYDPGRDPVTARRARDRVLADLGRRGVFSAETIARAQREPLPPGRRKPPFEAPHFARFAARRAEGKTRVATTLDRRLQRIVEARSGPHVRRLRAEGIGNLAVLVVETEGRRVRAWKGSADFHERAFAGQVDGVIARRSPGSTLKPLLYAQAYDDGLIVPESLLLDVPTDFAGYVAENYDGLYRGPVEARWALAHSLNAPAVRLLARLGLERFHGLLLQGGLENLDRPAHHYGLPLVLGAGEVSLYELVQLYAMLADGGLFRPLRFEAAEIERRELPGAGLRLLSAEAAWLATEAMLAVERPDLPASWKLTRAVPPVAWKTGTSYGHRDAWAVGFSRRYTIGVWVGNFDGRPRQGISGSEHAAPLLFDLFRALEPGGRGPAKDPGLRLGELEVCALSRERPGAFCPERLHVAALPGRTRLAVCSQHRRALAEVASGELVAAACAGAVETAWREYTVQPPELVAWWRSTGQPVPELPAVAARCAGGTFGQPPEILSPDGATLYRLRRHVPLRDQRLALIARADPTVRRLFWYEDGRLVASGAPGEQLLLELARGEHHLVVTDDQGRSHGVRYKVE